MALSDLKVRSAKPEVKAYKLTHGDGMVLLVHPNGSQYWRLRNRFGGKEKMLALGKYPEVSFADARARRNAVERQISHQERSSVRAAYIHKAEHFGECRLILQWWADFLDVNREKGISPFDFAKLGRLLATFSHYIWSGGRCQFF
jgi:hypothetical protein